LSVCLTGNVGTYNIKVTYVDSFPDLCGSISKIIPVTFTNCSCPPPTADAGGPYSETVVCPGDTATIDFSGSASGTGEFTYFWDFGDGNSSTEQNPQHTYTYPFNSPYTVTLTVTGDGVNECGSDIDTTTVNISYIPCEECPPPTADAGGPYNETVICPDDNDVTVTFSGSASGTGALTYDWDFGDGTIALDAGPTPSHTYTYPFTGSPYTVTLTVTGDGENACGSDTDTTTVTIDYVPCCEPCVVDFIAGQSIDVGDVTVSTDGVNLIVTFNTTGCWFMTETHLYVGTTPPTNHSPGQLGYQHTNLNTQLDTYTIPLSSISNFACEGSLYFAAHAVVECENNSQTAWGEGTDFGGGWAMYFQCPTPCECY